MPDRMAHKFWILVLASVAIILLAIYLSLTNGTFDLSVLDVVKTLLRIDPSPEHDLVVFQFRLPRIIIGALVGFGLGVAGSVMQAITRNPLADPGILGINAGAGTAVVLFILLFQGSLRGIGWQTIMMMPLFGIAGGLSAVALIYLFARQNGRLDPQRLVLVGIAVGMGFGAATLYISLKMNPQDFEMATVWLTGSIYNANWVFIVSMLPWFLVLPFLLYKSKVLDVLHLGEDIAKSLGVATEREKNLLFLSSVCLVSACVSVSGSVGFVGLIAPHIARRLLGLQHRYLLPLCGLIGMMMVIVADLIGRMVFAPAQLSVGIVIAIIGVPYFVFLLFKSKS